MNFLMLTLICVSEISGSNPTADERLLLTPLILSNRTKEARDLSKVTGLSVNGSESYAGFISVDSRSHMFFWLFVTKRKSNAPLVVWLNGGPGVSSLSGLFMQNGPFKLTKDLRSFFPRDPKETLVGPLSVVYIDNPIGVGFSNSESGNGGLRTSIEEIGNDLVAFVQQFVIMFPQYATTSEVYVFGQSYGAKYAIILARKIIEMKIEINLKGVCIGGAYADPPTQYLYHQDYAYSLGVISHHQRMEAKMKIKKDFKTLNNGLTNPNESFWSIVGSYNNFDPPGAYDNILNKNAFNFNATFHIGQLKSFQSSLHARPSNYTALNTPAQFALKSDLRSSVKGDLAALLNDNKKVLFYNGMFDMTTNTDEIEGMLLSTNWTGLEDYKNEIRTPWLRGDQVLGYYSNTLDQLCRVVVNRGGHNTGNGLPDVFIEMILSFVERGCI